MQRLMRAADEAGGQCGNWLMRQLVWQLWLMQRLMQAAGVAADEATEAACGQCD